MKPNNSLSPKCEKCKGRTLIKEPAGVSCFTCGWFKYLSNDRKLLWKQYHLNSQYFSTTRATILRLIYRVDPRRSFTPLTEDEQRMFEYDPRLSLENSAFYEEAPDWFCEKELTQILR